MLDIISFVVGPILTNAFLIGDSKSKQAVVIDPGWDGQLISQEANNRDWVITAIWLTHAHFDHIGGVPDLFKILTPFPELALHRDDLRLWQEGGGAAMFGLHIPPLPEPDIYLEHDQVLRVGENEFIVKHTPGHTPGHVIFVSQSEGLVFSGDLIFSGSVGRTDFPGGSYQKLIESIHSEILTLRDDTRLYSGHGPETTVGEERVSNPYLV